MIFTENHLTKFRSV